MKRISIVAVATLIFGCTFSPIGKHYIAKKPNLAILLLPANATDEEIIEAYRDSLDEMIIYSNTLEKELNSDNSDSDRDERATHSPNSREEDKSRHTSSPDNARDERAKPESRRDRNSEGISSNSMDRGTDVNESHNRDGNHNDDRTQGHTENSERNQR